jgi:hypothetical protein
MPAAVLVPGAVLVPVGVLVQLLAVQQCCCMW